MHNIFSQPNNFNPKTQPPLRHLPQKVRLAQLISCFLSLCSALFIAAALSPLSVLPIIAAALCGALFPLLGWLGCCRYAYHYANLAKRWHKIAQQYCQLAQTDALTGLGNLAAFQLAASKDCYAAGHPLCLLLIDLDGLKETNDRFGHEAGDELLRQTAAYLYASTAGLGEAFRIGGDEFILLLPNCTDNAAYSFLVKLRTTAAEMHFSCGMAYRKESDGQSIMELRQAADIALYQEKHNKRKTVSSGKTIDAAEATA